MMKIAEMLLNWSFSDVPFFGTNRGPSPMETLPDDLVVEVLSYVDTVQLVTVVRAVCRRWRELALSPDAWSHRELRFSEFFDRGRSRLLQHILSVAPRLRKINTVTSFGTFYPENGPAPEALLRRARGMLELACSSSVPVQHLELELSQRLQLASEDCVRLLRHYLDLGRLRRIGMRVFCRPSELSPLLVLAAEQRLDALEIVPWSVRQRSADGEMSWAEAVRAAPWGIAEIRRLNFSGIALVQVEPEEDFVAALLSAAAAANVEELKLMSCELTGAFSGIPLTALGAGGFPRLRKLEVGAGDDMTAALACPQLRSLVLHLDQSLVAKHPDLGQFIRRATALTELCVHFTPSSASAAVDLLELLAATGRSSVQTLTLRSNKGPPVESFLALKFTTSPGRREQLVGVWGSALSRLPAALKGFPELRRLTLDFPWEAASDRVIAFLEDFDAATLPKLEVLALYPRFTCQSGVESLRDCNPAPAVFRLVLGSPRLHILLAMEFLIQPASDCVMHWRPPEVGFYAHPQDEPCKLHDTRMKKWNFVTPDHPDKIRERLSRPSGIVGSASFKGPKDAIDATMYQFTQKQDADRVMTVITKLGVMRLGEGRFIA